MAVPPGGTRFDLGSALVKALSLPQSESARRVYIDCQIGRATPKTNGLSNNPQSGRALAVATLLLLLLITVAKTCHEMLHNVACQRVAACDSVAARPARVVFCIF